MTTDIDIILKNTPENTARFIAAASNWGEGNAAQLNFDDFQGPGAVRIVEDFPLDVFTLVDGRTYESFAPNVTKHTIAGGIVVPSFSIADLIEVKAKTLREKDQLDVTVLRRMQSQTTSANEPSVILLDPHQT